MRCAELQDHLAETWQGPGRPTSSAVAEHLSACPACAARFEGTRQLALVWDATRPESPAEADWEAAWTRISQAVETPAPAVLPVAASSRRGPWRARAAMWSAGLATLAALLLLAVFPPDRGGSLLDDRPTVVQGDPAEGSIPAGPILGSIDIPAGQITLYSVDRGALQLVEEPDPDVYGDFLAFYGHVETLDRGHPIRWFVDVNPGQTVLYSVDHDVKSVVNTSPVFAWVPEVDDEFFTDFYAVAECEFRFGVLALNGDQAAGPLPTAH